MTNATKAKEAGQSSRSKRVRKLADTSPAQFDLFEQDKACLQRTGDEVQQPPPQSVVNATCMSDPEHSETKTPDLSAIIESPTGVTRRHEILRAYGESTTTVLVRLEQLRRAAWSLPP